MKEQQETYYLPEGWKLVRLDDVAIIVTGNTPPTNNKAYFNGDIPFYKPSDLNKDYVKDSKDRLSELGKEYSRILPQNSILITCIGSTIGKSAIISKEGAFNQQINGVLPILCNPLFFYYQIISQKFQNLIRANASATTVAILNKSKLGNLPFLITSLDKQNLIATQIGLLFSKLEEAEKSLKQAKKELTVYRYALLKNLFEGKLTTKWRKENTPNNAKKVLHDLNSDRDNYYEKALIKWKEEFSNWEKNGKNGLKPVKPKEFQVFPYVESNFDNLPKLPTEWKWVHWNDILDYKEDSFKRGPFGSSLTKSIFVKSGYKVYEQYCPINDDVSFERYYITSEKYEELKSFSVRKGDYLISCAGTVGRITQIPEKFKEGVINQALLRLRINKKYINSKFFLHFFRSPYFQKQIFENSKGSAIPNLKGVKELKIIPIPLLSIEEQNVIVEILESRFTLVDNLEKTVDNVLNEIIALKHSILKKAFEGRLISYTSNESVENMLNDIQEEKRLYLENQKELSRSKPKQKRQMEEKKSILEILKESNSPISAQELWAKSTSDGDIERFYSEIKEIYHQIDELKTKTESLLSLKDENK